MKLLNKYKKSIPMCIGFLFLINFLGAQNLSVAQNYFEKNNIINAKETIDSFVNLFPSEAKGWYLKAVIYGAIGKNIQAKDLVADNKGDAFFALKKANELDAIFVNDQLKKDNYKLLLSLYNDYTNAGLAYFNNGVGENSAESFKWASLNFKQARAIKNYGIENKWTKNNLDTLNIFYNSMASINYDNQLDALIYSKLIVDNNIITITNSQSCETIYQWLVFYYKNQNDSINFFKYSTIALKAYPQSDYFFLLKIDWFRKYKDYQNLFTQYQQILKIQPKSYKYQIAYCKDLYNYLYTNKTHYTSVAMDKNTLFNTLLNLLKDNTQGTAAMLLLGKAYSNEAAISIKQQAYKNLYNKANYYLATIVNKYPNTEKSIYTEALHQLIINYKALGMVSEAATYQGKFKIKE